MAAYSLSSKASDDLDGIYEYSILSFGLTQARAYLRGLHALLCSLADHPARGRLAPRLATGLRRFEYQSHIVFYVPEDDGILIVRVLHQSMDLHTYL